MIGKRQFWKSYAKEFLQGKWGAAVLGMLLVGFLNTVGLVSVDILFPGEGILSIILGEIYLLIISMLTMVVSTGYNYMLLNMARRREYRLGDLFAMFKRGSDGVLVAAFLMALIEIVLMLPSYILGAVPGQEAPGAIAMLLGLILSLVVKLPFALVFFLLADAPQMKGMEALKESVRLMKGHIGQFFVLQLSFVPLLFLSVFTLYIGLLWLMPYMNAAITVFYMYVTGELEEKHRSHIQEMTGYSAVEDAGIQSVQEPEAPRTGDDYDSEA